MKKLLFAALLALAFSSGAGAQTLNKFVVRCEAPGSTVTTAGTASTTKHPISYASSAVRIYQPGTTTDVSLFSDSAGLTPLANPGTCSSSAQFTFYASPAYVDVRLSPSGVSPFTTTWAAVSVVGVNSPLLTNAATTSALGHVKMSVAPADPASPVAVGDNDPRVNLAYNVKTYGAVCDGSSHPLSGTYSTLAAAQAAYPGALSLSDETDLVAAYKAVAAVPSAGGTVQFPNGVCVFNRPLQVLRGNISLVGSPDRQSSAIRGTFAGGPVILTSSYTSFPTAAALLTGAGSSMQLNAGYDKWLNLRDTKAAELNGLSALTVECTFKIGAFSVGPGSVYGIMQSTGRLLSTDSQSTTFFLGTTEDGSAEKQAQLKVGGTLYTLTTSGAPYVAGNTYHLALTYDGATIRFFVNGNLVASQAATGTVTQSANEDVVIGRVTQDFPDASSINPALPGQIDSVRFSNVARYTSGFAPPSAKFTDDSSTLLLLNFDEQTGPMTRATTRSGYAYLVIRQSSPATFMSQVHIDGLRIEGGLLASGIFFFATNNSSIKNVYVESARDGIVPYNNSYLNRYSNIRINLHANDTRTRFGILNNFGGVSFYDNTAISGGRFQFISAESGIAISHMWISNEDSIVGAAFLNRSGAQGTSTISDLIITDEGATGSPIRAQLILDGALSASVSGGVVQLASAATPPVILVGGGGASFSGTNFQMHSGTARVATVLGTPTQPFSFLSASQNRSPTVPWTNNARYQTVIDSNGFLPRSQVFASLGTPPDGTIIYCSDCTAGSSPLTGGGTGCVAVRQNGAWKGL